MGVTADVELGEVAIIATAIGVIGWALYKAYGSVAAGLTHVWNSVSNAASDVGQSITTGSITSTAQDVAQSMQDTGQLNNPCNY